jgi:hypothetical protein
VWYNTSMYQDLALEILFTGTLDPVKHGLEYRKGKTIDDVRKARQKALKNGHAKTEFEILMFEVYLKDVFKKVRK